MTASLLLFLTETHTYKSTYSTLITVYYQPKSFKTIFFTRSCFILHCFFSSNMHKTLNINLHFQACAGKKKMSPKCPWLGMSGWSLPPGVHTHCQEFVHNLCLGPCLHLLLCFIKKLSHFPGGYWCASSFIKLLLSSRKMLMWFCEK